MTLAQLLEDLNSRIGSEPEVTNARMTTWINQGLLSFCNTDDYHWLETAKTTSTVAGQSNYEQPSDCKRMIELKVDGDRYKYVRYEQRDIQPSDLKYYSVLNNEIILNPVPEATTSNNIEMSYIRRPEKMTLDTDSPSDSAIAGLPEVYHEALVIYAFSVYNTYDEEHTEAADLMGNKFRPRPGTFYWFVGEAQREEKNRKKGMRQKMLSTKTYYGYHHPNQQGSAQTVLGN